MFRPTGIRRILLNLGYQMVLLGATAATAHGFGPLNPLIQRVPAPGQAINGAPRPMELRKLRFDSCNSIAILDDQVLFVDPERNRVMSLQDGALFRVAGTGGDGREIDPTSALRTEFAHPQSLLVLNDQSVLVVCRVGPPDGLPSSVVLRIRTRAAQGEATVSVFAGNGQAEGAFIPASARDTALGRLSGLAQERDGSVLLVDASHSQILRVRPAGTIEVAVMRAPDGVVRDPGSRHLNLLNHPTSIAVLADDSILVGCQGILGYVLRIRNNVTTLYARQQPGAEHPIPIGTPDAIGTLPDGSVWIADRPSNTDPHIYQIAPSGGVTLIAGPAPDQAWPGIDFHRNYVSGLSGDRMGSIRSLTPLPDGSLLLGTFHAGMYLLSPGDAHQRHLKRLAERGRAAVLAGDAEAFKVVERELAYLCVPSDRSFAAVNHAARDQGRLEPVQPADPGQGRPEAVPLPPVPRPLMNMVHGFAMRAGENIAEHPDEQLGEQLRAQLVLVELRQFRRDHLEPYLNGLLDQGKAAVLAGNAEALHRVEQAIADAGVAAERFYAAVDPDTNPQGMSGVPVAAAFSGLTRGVPEDDHVAESFLGRHIKRKLARVQVQLALMHLQIHRQEPGAGQ